jgi:chemotaxis signal transduction protein
MRDYQQSIMTFYVEELLFGLDVAHVLFIGQDITVIKPPPAKQSGLVGMIRLKSIAIPVIDFAYRVGMHTATDEKKALQTQFKTVEQGYQDWFWEIQRKLAARQMLTHNELNQNANLLNWGEQTQSKDFALNKILTTLGQPKAIFIACFNQLITLIAAQHWQQAEILLEQQKALILAKIESILTKADVHLETRIRQVLLYLTKDGKTPSCALLVERINDVLSYPKTSFHSDQTELIGLGVIPATKQVVSGVYLNQDMPDCFYIHYHKLVEPSQQLSLPRA